MSENTISKNKSAGGRYNYTDLPAINEFLASQGITYYQTVEVIEGVNYIVTIPIVNGKELAPRRGVPIVDAALVGIKNPAQEQGSAVTYARRYSLLMAFGLASDDDDDDAQSLTIPKDQKASEYQIKTLRQYYQGENMQKLLDANDITDLHDMSMAKASELIKKLQERTK